MVGWVFWFLISHIHTFNKVPSFVFSGDISVLSQVIMIGPFSQFIGQGSDSKTNYNKYLSHLSSTRSSISVLFLGFKPRPPTIFHFKLSRLTKIVNSKLSICSAMTVWVWLHMACAYTPHPQPAEKRKFLPLLVPLIPLSSRLVVIRFLLKLKC